RCCSRIAVQYSRLLCCSIVPPMKKLLWQMTSLFSMCGSLTAYEDNQILLCRIQPGKPQQNGFIERFSSSFRREFLNAYLFESLSQVRELAWFWQQDYNQNRTHESLNHLPPEAYRKQLENSSLGCLN
ncbi:integrase core domain-containing protein, partial [Providencia stuartii]|uniref:integrase core domain-containing protein n=1 Tax=Providencia stuartii TaxID=588 RepID=UPI002989BF80